MGVSSCAACLSNLAYSIYSATRWRKESGSLKMTGIVILLRSLPSDNTEHRFTSEWPGTGNVVLKKKIILLILYCLNNNLINSSTFF